jgi:hypothetical protein
VVEQLRAFIKRLNIARGTQVKEPLFVFLTAYSNKSLKSHLSQLKIEHVYEKPLFPEQLVEILELVE